MRAFGAAYWMDDVPVVEGLRLRRAPMMAAALCFAAGDAMALQWQSTAYLAAGVLLLVALTIVSLHAAKRVAVFAVLGLWAAVGCWCAQIQPSIAPQDGLTHYADGLSRSVRGRVIRVRMLKALSAAGEDVSHDPGAWESESGVPGGAKEQVDLAVEAVEDVTPDVSTMMPVSGGVRVTVRDGLPVLKCGDVLQMPLRLRVPDAYRDPGAWDHVAQLLGDGIGVQAGVKQAQIAVVGGAEASWRCRLYAAQTWAAGRMDAFVASPANRVMPAVMRLDEQDAAMLSAMLFGDRGGLRHSLRVGFERTGTFHLFVVSGMHIVLLSGAVFWLLRKLRMPEGLAVGVTIGLATSYALLTGFGVPVQRALGMTAVYLIARWLAREAGAINALGTAAVAVLAIDPRALYEAGFQMTFLVIIAVAGLAVPIMERLFEGWKSAVHDLWLLRLDAASTPAVAALRVRLRMFGVLLGQLMALWARDLPVWVMRGLLWFGNLLVLGIVVEVCMVLPMAVYFHRATVLALPSNLVALPLIGTLMGFAVVMFCASLVSAWLAMIPAAVVGLLLHGVNWVVHGLGHAAIADMRVPAPEAGVIAVALGLLWVACWMVRARGNMWCMAGVVTLGMVPLAVLWPEPPLVHKGVWEVTALDVGQGDSLLVVSPEGRTMLVDAGGPVGQAPSEDRWDVGEEVVAPYVWSRRIRRLDVVLLTHAHSDHMGGMPAVLRDLRPRELWLSVEPGISPDLHALLVEAADLGVVVRWFRAGDAFGWGGLQASVLAPEVGYVNGRTAVNDDSLVMRLSYGKASVLLEGDAEAPSEMAMLSHGRVLASTLLKVGHHGSNTSSGAGFLAAVKPVDAVISVGRHNTFGHPRFEVLGRLQAAGTKTYRTDRDGAESFWLREDGGILAASASSN